MKTIKLLAYTVFVLLLSISISSCSGDDGAAGAAGADGANGQDGVDGQDGSDGNANVNTYTFDVSGENGSAWSITATQLTDDVLDNDVIISYLKRGSTYYPIPGTSYNYEIKTYYYNPTIELLFYNRASGAIVTPTVGEFTLLKMVIIESSSTTTGRTAFTKKAVYAELEAANINVNDYYAVCNYYGINPE